MRDVERWSLELQRHNAEELLSLRAAGLPCRKSIGKREVIDVPFIRYHIVEAFEASCFSLSYW